MKLKMLDHYHGDLSNRIHLHKDTVLNIPADLPQDAADELVARGKAAWISQPATAAVETVKVMETKRGKK